MANRRPVGQGWLAGALEGAATSLQGNLRTELADKRAKETRNLEQLFELEKQRRLQAHQTSERENELVPVTEEFTNPAGQTESRTTYQVRSKAAGSKMGSTREQRAADVTATTAAQEAALEPGRVAASGRIVRGQKDVASFTNQLPPTQAQAAAQKISQGHLGVAQAGQRSAETGRVSTERHQGVMERIAQQNADRLVAAEADKLPADQQAAFKVMFGAALDQETSGLPGWMGGGGPTPERMMELAGQIRQQLMGNRQPPGQPTLVPSHGTPQTREIQGPNGERKTQVSVDGGNTWR